MYSLVSPSFSAAVPLAVKALYLHHGLSNNSLKGPAMSVNPKVVHSLIEKAVTVGAGLIKIEQTP